MIIFLTNFCGLENPEITDGGSKVAAVWKSDNVISTSHDVITLVDALEGELLWTCYQSHHHNFKTLGVMEWADE